MCIALFNTGTPGYKLVIVANRDEFYDRPATQAAWHNWDIAPGSDLIASGAGTGSSSGGSSNGEGTGGVLSGVDISIGGGGTWLGMTRDMRIGVLTNIRPTVNAPIIRKPGAPSRGALLRDFLTTSAPDATITTGLNSSSSSSSSYPPPLQAYLDSQTSADAYDGFNLLLFQPSPQYQPDGEDRGKSSGSVEFEVGYICNKPDVTKRIIPISPGKSYGLSNSHWDNPWPKVVKGQSFLEEALARSREEGESEEGLVERLMGIMTQSIPLHNLGDAPKSIRIPTVTIQGKEYGTRATTVILVKESGEVVFVERTFGPRENEGQGGGADGVGMKEDATRWFRIKSGQRSRHHDR